MILVTGGAGFIGTNFILECLKHYESKIIVLDALTYAGNFSNFDQVEPSDRLIKIEGDINDLRLLSEIFNKYQPEAVFHFAAESHVDRSISGPRNFIDSNILGTFNLLMSSREFLDAKAPRRFKFFHISTDEVFGSLENWDPSFSESSNYSPNSPYSASKASSDMLVRSFIKTFNFPAIITNCSNNFGPFQSPEKLIPLTVFNAINEKKIPIYGDGNQIRDWLFVQDHVKALLALFELDSYDFHNFCIGGDNEITNINLVREICTILDNKQPRRNGASYSKLITHVEDRLGHDFRYSVNSDRIKSLTAWKPSQNFEENLKYTVEWFLKNESWMNDMRQRQEKE